MAGNRGVRRGDSLRIVGHLKTNLHDCPVAISENCKLDCSSRKLGPLQDTMLERFPKLDVAG